jgi:hypothetical protein
MIISTNDFLAQCEQTGEYTLAQHMIDSFIESMQMCNPHRKDMSRADWLSYMINEYHIEVSEDSMQIVPNSNLILK